MTRLTLYVLGQIGQIPQLVNIFSVLIHIYLQICSPGVYSKFYSNFMIIEENNLVNVIP